MTLRDLAHGRAGDKGNLVNISIIAYDIRDYPRIVAVVTPERVRAHLSAVAVGDVVRYELPQLGALNFVVRRAPHDTVTLSLAIDTHGKSLSSALLTFRFPMRRLGSVRRD